MASSVAEIERELADLRGGAGELGRPPMQRTSVMTHIAWVPPDWEEAAESTLAGLAERHPSRTILLFPQPDAEDSLDMDASLTSFAFGDKAVCAEVIRVRMCGARALHPASIVIPLLVSDLPVFCRWRGRPPFDDLFDELVNVVDRLIVDSTEWPSDTLSQGYGLLAERFERAAISDIAWARTHRWRRVLAGAWPFEGRKISVVGTHAQALLLGGWLRSRLQHDVEVEHEPADVLTSVAVDGVAIDAPPGDAPLPSDLLSDELDTFTRDRVYEEAVRAAAI
jgi:glucose-6-phosphate dehydrogenase assembly protein OpcA